MSGDDSNPFVIPNIRSSDAIIGDDHEPTNQPNNLPSYRSLRTKDVLFYTKLQKRALEKICNTFPEEIRRSIPDNAVRQTLLAFVLTQRDEEPKPTSDVTNKETLLRMNPAEVSSLAQSNQEELTTLMISTLKLSPQIQPRDVSNISQDRLALIAIKWIWDHQKLSNSRPATAAPDVPPPSLPNPEIATRDSNESREQLPTANVDPLRDLIRQSMNPSQINKTHTQTTESGSSPEVRAKTATRIKSNHHKNDKFSGDEIDEFHPKGWRCTGSKMEALKRRLGQSSNQRDTVPMLRIKGPVCHELILGWTATGTNVEHFVTHYPWMRSQTTGRSHQEIEALQLARIIDTTIMTYPTMLEAMEMQPCIEIASRRLHAIIRVEEQVSNSVVTRGEAWEEMNNYLESFPGKNLRNEHLEDLAYRQLSRDRKRAAVREARWEAQRKKSKKASKRTRRSRPASRDLNEDK